MIPLGRLGYASEVAGMAAFLALGTFPLNNSYPQTLKTLEPVQPELKPKVTYPQPLLRWRACASFPSLSSVPSVPAP
jgi:hypothetical protein